MRMRWMTRSSRLGGMEYAGTDRKRDVLLFRSQMLDGLLHLAQQLFAHLAGKAVTDEDALDDEVFAVRGHGIRGNRSEERRVALPISDARWFASSRATALRPSRG